MKGQVVDEDLEKLAFAAAKVLAREALYNNLEEALETLKRLWKDGILQMMYIRTFISTIP